VDKGEGIDTGAEDNYPRPQKKERKKEKENGVGS